ncbi:MAG: sulfotransferase family protein [Jiangellaceae bacterium]
MPVLRRYPATYARTAVESRRLRDDLAGVRSFLMFVGHPRSGHSLVGALLDAHPNMLVAHELDVLKYVEAGFRRDQLFVLLLRQQQARVATGHVSSTGYAYAVPGQWQGRYERLEVIGDKKGGRSTLRLEEQPELLDRLADRVDAPIRVVQVVRNPYDNIATMHRRAPKVPLADHAAMYFRLAATADAVREHVGAAQFHEVHLEDLTAEPADVLRGLCAFLDVSADHSYLGACASIVYFSPRQTRGNAPWTPALRDTVAARMADHPALRRYLSDDEGGPAATTMPAPSGGTSTP